MTRLRLTHDRLGGGRQALARAIGSWQRRTFLGLLLGLSGGAFLLGLAGHAPSLSGQVGSEGSDAKERVAQAHGRLPLTFEPNRGQTDARVEFLARGHGYRLFLTPREAVLDLDVASQTRATGKTQKPTRGAVLRMRPVGANPQPSVLGSAQLPGRVNYLLGDDARRWRVGIPTFAKVLYREVYPGVDLSYYGRQGRLEYDFVIRPGADPKVIALRFAGAEHLHLTSRGDLLLRLDGGELRLQKPRIYQELDGVRRDVPGGYVRMGSRVIGFDLGTYDASRPLVIDPVLSYSTYLGGGGDEQGNLIAVDGAGNAYLTGRTASLDFPTTAGADSSLGGTQDAFVTKLNATGSALVYSTYLGGSGLDDGETLAIDANSNAYVIGFTMSSDFPTLGAVDSSLGGDEDAFVTKLSPSGALAYSTYLGGGGRDEGFGIAVDSAANAYAAGQTFSSDFPTVGAVDSSLGGAADAFMAKLNAAGSALSYSTYLGGSGWEQAGSIALDSASNAYAVGQTGSSDFPTTLGAFDTTLGGAQTQNCAPAPPLPPALCDAFVTKLNAFGSALAYSTYLGGSNDESVPFGIAVDTSFNAYVTSRTFSSDFPTTRGAFDTTLGGTQDAFVTKLNPSGSALVYSTYLGGSGSERSFSIAVDDSRAWVTGRTLSSDFPTIDPLDSSLGGNQDAFVTKLNRPGAGLQFSTYLGGSGTDQGVGIALDSASPNPNAYIIGATGSSDFPTTPGAFDTTLAGSSTSSCAAATPCDAFVSKIAQSRGRGK
jgi:Beta-propeller repeat